MTDLRSFIDRVLYIKEMQDTYASDIREIYAEAKAVGFDKTAMGQLVAYLRKREKDPQKFETGSILFETYLNDYEHGTPLATRAHAHEGGWSFGDLPGSGPFVLKHDPSTGELIEEPALRAHLDGQTGAGGAAPAPDAAETRAVNEHGNKIAASHVGEGASVLSPPISAPPIADQGLDSIGIPQPELLSSPAEFPDLPKQFDRRASA